MKTRTITLGKEQFILDGRKTLYHTSSKTLIISNLDSSQTSKTDKDKKILQDVIREYSPHTVLMIGEQTLPEWLREFGTSVPVIQIGPQSPPHILRTVLVQYTPITQPQDQYVLSGQISPGIELALPGDKKILAPCMWVKPNSAIMPAFSASTANAISTKPQDKIFMLASGFVIEK